MREGSLCKQTLFQSNQHRTTEVVGTQTRGGYESVCIARASVSVKQLIKILLERRQYLTVTAGLQYRTDMRRSSDML